jgi:hypothetical protein
VEGGEEAHGPFDHHHGTRDHQRATLEAGNPMTLAAVVLLALISPIFADVMFAEWQGAVIRGVIVGTICFAFIALLPLHESAFDAALAAALTTFNRLCLHRLIIAKA